MGALFVAKLHKLGDRLETPDRLEPKDAGDVYRLLTVATPIEMAAVLRRLLTDDRSSDVTNSALQLSSMLFLTPRSDGVQLAVSALQAVVPSVTVTTFVTGYVRALLAELE